jgi:hypothetical protein
MLEQQRRITTSLLPPWSERRDHHRVAVAEGASDDLSR